MYFSLLYHLHRGPVFKVQQHSYSCMSLSEKNNLFWGLAEDVKTSKKKKKKIDTWVTPNSKTHPHALQSREEEAKGRLLPVPLGHLLTFSLDFSKFGLRRDLCDTFHADAFKEYSSLGEKREGWTWTGVKEAHSHT